MPIAYPPGSTVLIFFPSRESKLYSWWQGPYRVINEGRPHPARGPYFTVSLILPDGSTELASRELHTRCMRPYHTDRDPTGEIAAARAAAVDEYIVAGVVATTAETLQPAAAECSCKRQHLRWQVNWRGLPSDRDTWEPPSFLISVPMFQAYNVAHHLTTHAKAQAACERAHPFRVL